MPMKKLVLAAAVALSAALAMPAFAADMTLRVGSSNSPDSALGRGLNKVADLVAKANVGLTLQIFPSGQLGDPQAQVQNVKLGVQDAFFEDLTWWAPFAPNLRAAGVPFEFSGREHFQKWLASDTFTEIQKNIVNNGGQRVLTGDVLWWRGPYRVLMTTKPVNSLDDITKIKLRQPAIEALTRYWGKDGLGSNVVNIGWGDVYLAIKQGAADGVTLPLDLVESTKFVEVAPYIAKTDEFPQILVFGINEAKWQAMTPEQQKALSSALDEAGKGYNEEVSTSEQKWKEELSAEGAKFSVLDRAPFVAKVQELDKKYEAEGYWPKGLLESVDALR